MQVLTATLRHRELTQEIFNIGDEVATFIENIADTVAATMPDGDEQMKRPTPMNAQLLRNQFPITNNSPVMVQEINHILQDRTELVRQYLAHIVDWELAETEKAVRSAEDERTLLTVFGYTSDAVTSAAKAWREAVVADYPGVTRTMRGSHPPEFLNERARIDAVVARVKAKMGRAAGAHVS